MAYDAAMVCALVCELEDRIIGARIEKVNQPDKDGIVLLLHRERENLRFAIYAATNNPHFNITSNVAENPLTPPMFCMLLRKHLTGARICSVKQLGFERILEIGLNCYDELGFETKKYLIAETMGKYSNIILLNGEKKVISALKLIDLATSSVRQILPGFEYEMPAVQKKLSPMENCFGDYSRLFDEAENMPIEKFILSRFYGFAAITAREIAYRAAGGTDKLLSDTNKNKLWESLSFVVDTLKNKKSEPYIVIDENGRPIEYLFFEPLEYAEHCTVKKVGSFGELLDEYFEKRQRAERMHRRTADILRILTNAEARLQKKMALQRDDLAECGEKDTYKLWGDLITGNIYRLKKGQDMALLENYFDEKCPTIKIPLDKRLSPQQNAQKYYKKYNKLKTAEIELAKQIKLAQTELEYIYTVLDSLSRVQNESDISEIRQELYHSGYASKMKNYIAKKNAQPKVMEFKSSGGYRILCGKNNHQNDYITTKVANKSDYWFHVKNRPGSHVVLCCNGEEPPEADFTEAAMIAAFYSGASEGVNVAVDYTKIKNVKKPAGSKPGFVIYTTNYTAYVTPSEAAILAMRCE